MSGVKRVLVYGGKGALGRTCVTYFRQQNWWVGSLDLTANDEADANIVISTEGTLVEQETQVLTQVQNVLEGQKLNAILCVAGGWAGGNPASDDFVRNTQMMIEQSVYSSVIASKLAAKYLTDGGLLTLTGAKAALESTPGMVGYGLAKAAVHHLTLSLGSGKSGLPEGSSVISILPVTLDTPMNRKFMPKADFSVWTPLEFVAQLLYGWSEGNDRPKSGSLQQLITTDGQTQVMPA